MVNKYNYHVRLFSDLMLILLYIIGNNLSNILLCQDMNPTVPDNTNTIPSIRIVQSKDIRFVIVLDVSGSMGTAISDISPVGLSQIYY